MRRRVLQHLQKLITHELITGSFYLFAGSMVANFLALLTNIFFAHNLSKADFGIYSTLVALITLVSIPSQSISTVIVQFATKYFAKNEIPQAVAFYRKILKTVIAFVCIILLFAIVLLQPLSSFLHIRDLFLIILASFVIGFVFLGSMHTAFLQSLLCFKYMAALMCIGSIAKLTIGYLLISLFLLGVGGAMWAVAFSFTLPFLVSIYPLRFLFRKKADVVIHIPVREIVRYAVPVSVIVLAVFALTSVDVIMAKHFFSPDDAGSYAALSTIGRIIFYFTSTIPMVMFPLVIKRFTNGEDYKGLFYLSVALVLVPSLGITLFYFLFPAFVLAVVVSGKYNNIAQYLWLMGLYLSVFSVINVYINFFLSLKRTYIMYPTGLAAILQIILIVLFHQNFYHILYASITSSIVLLSVLIFLSLRVFTKKQILTKELHIQGEPPL